MRSASPPHPDAIHGHLVRIADDVSARLADALRIVGPVTLDDRSRDGIGYFLSRAVVGQQLSTKAARSIWRRVISTASADGLSVTALFTATNADRLRQCGVSRAKVRALCGIRDAEQAGRLSSKSLSALDQAERTRQLRALFGVGPWTCDMASIFYYRCPDIWPEGDVAVQRTFRRLIGPRKPEPLARRFTPYRSYLALSMWRLVDRTPEVSD